MTKVISVSLPLDLIEIIDEAAKANYESRSDYLRVAAIARLRSDLEQQDLTKPVIKQELFDL